MYVYVVVCVGIGRPSWTSIEKAIKWSSNLLEFKKHMVDHHTHSLFFYAYVGLVRVSVHAKGYVEHITHVRFIMC